MSQLKKSAKSIGVIVVFTIGSKALGFIREALIASTYGSGANTDTFFIALSAITLFSLLLTETINTTLIPVLSDIEVHDGKKGKMRHLNNFLNTITLVALTIAFFAFFLTPSIMKILGRGFEENQFNYAVLLTRIGLPTLVISSIVGIFRGYLQSEERFIESALADLPFNFVYITFLLFLSQYFTITALMVAAIAAEASRLLIQIPSLQKIGYRYKFTIDLKDDYMRKMAVLIPPILLSVGISDLNNLVDKSMASSLTEGSVSALNYAAILQGVILSVFITAIITVIFPILSKEANAGNYTKLKKVMQTSLNIVLLITIPATIGMIVLSNPIVKFAYQRGQFGDRAALMTSSALVFYSAGLIGSGVKILLTRVFYALQDTKTPMVNSFYALILNIVFNLLLVQSMGHSGLAFASTLSTTLTGIFLLYELRKKIGRLGLKTMIESSVKIMISAIIMGIVVYFFYNYSLTAIDPSRLIELVILILAVLLGAATYVISLYIFKVDELHFLTENIKKRLNKTK